MHNRLDERPTLKLIRKKLEGDFWLFSLKSNILHSNIQWYFASKFSCCPIVTNKQSLLVRIHRDKLTINVNNHQIVKNLSHSQHDSDTISEVEARRRDVTPWRVDEGSLETDLSPAATSIADISWIIIYYPTKYCNNTALKQIFIYCFPFPCLWETLLMFIHMKIK